MQSYTLRLIPQQPLQLDDPATIPARTIRGALIAALQRNCHPNAIHDSGPCGPDCAFWSVLGTSVPGIRIGNAYATGQDSIGLHPGSARTCDLLPGFREQGGHGVSDVAIRAWVYERVVMSDPSQMLMPFEERCLVCGAELVPCTGRLVRAGEREWYRA